MLSFFLPYLSSMRASKSTSIESRKFEDEFLMLLEVLRREGIEPLLSVGLVFLVGPNSLPCYRLE